MSILSRYLLRLHVGPFIFALGALTSLLLLNQIAKRLGDLLGKGLPWAVIVEVFALSIPFIVAMTLPMATLVAVLYVVTRLAGGSEITALRAGGISLGRIMRPLLLAGLGVSIVAFIFSDHVLPRSNHRLRTLYTDIARKKPTFSIKEQVINEVQRSKFFLRAAAIDPVTYALLDVTIWDLTDQDRNRIIYADSGYLAITANQEDALLTLYDGTMHEFDRAEPAMFQQVGFSRDIVVIAGVGNELKRTLSDSYKGDREMGICEMEEVVRAARHEERLARRRADGVRRNGLRALVGLAPIPVDTAVPPVRQSVYCRALLAASAWLLPGELAAQDQTSRRTSIARRVTTGAAASVSRGRRGILRGSEVRAFADRERQASIRSAHFLVEIHKKYAIAVASFVFVLVGVPIGIRFPRGGAGLVIGVSTAVFGIFYIGLIAGESLADRLVVPPWFLWTPNLGLALIGLVLLRRLHHEAAPRTGWLARFSRRPVPRTPEAEPSPV